MSAWSTLQDGIRKAILMQDRLERLTAQVTRFEDRLLDHDQRLVRLETMVEIAQSRQADQRKISGRSEKRRR